LDFSVFLSFAGILQWEVAFLVIQPIEYHVVSPEDMIELLNTSVAIIY
jgi:hypothetical protein